LGSRPAVPKNAGLPRGVLHERLPDGMHEYTIPGLYIEGEQYHRLVKVSTLRTFFPSCVAASINPATRVLRVTTTSQVADLKAVVDSLTRGRGIVPYWSELQRRECRADVFEPDLFKLVFRTVLDDVSGWQLWGSRSTEGGSFVLSVSRSAGGKGKDHRVTDFEVCLVDGRYKAVRLAGERLVTEEEARPRWGVKGRRKRSASLRLPQGRDVTVRLDRTARACMCSSRYALRVYGPNERYVWEDYDSLRGYCQVGAADLDRDGIDEIIVSQRDHERLEILVFHAHSHTPSPADPSPIECVRRLDKRIREMRTKAGDAGVQMGEEARLLGFEIVARRSSLPEPEDVPLILSRLAAVEQVLNALLRHKLREVVRLRCVVDHEIPAPSGTRVLLIEMVAVGRPDLFDAFLSDARAQCDGLLLARAIRAIPASGEFSETAEIQTLEFLFAISRQRESVPPQAVP